jgi:tRNA dimethylallyltransferase
MQALLIAGPTASGKSALAIHLAKKFDGVVINADSMQVYQPLRVLTARPTEEEEVEVAHALFGHVGAGQPYSVAHWLADATQAIAAIQAQGRLPIVTGGTGMYFRALTEGLSDIPAVPDEIRVRLRALEAEIGVEALHARLMLCDPETASSLNPTDPQRVIRAMEVFEATGRSIRSFQGPRHGAVIDPARALSVFLEPDREVLRARIDARFDGMMHQGALQEVEALARLDLDPALPVMRAHGVPGLIAALRGDWSMAQAIEKGKADTRRYAKRQHTWFRHQAPDFIWMKPDEAQARISILLDQARSPITAGASPA